MEQDMINILFFILTHKTASDQLDAVAWKVECLTLYLHSAVIQRTTENYKILHIYSMY